MSEGEKESRYIQYLPPIYQGEKDDPSQVFLTNFLKAFEKILSGINDGVNFDGKPVKGIEEILDKLYNYFDPNETPANFLKWLAGWVALTLKEGEGWNEEKKRELISQIVPLYQKRGTKEGLEEYLKIYAGEGVRIIDELGPLRVGISSRVGVDTVIGGLPPYFFIVNLTLPVPDPKAMIEKQRAIEELIDLEKPAYTYYRKPLDITIPTMQVGRYSHVGVDTLLWKKL